MVINRSDEIKTQLQIVYLIDHQEFIPTIAKWHHEQSSYLNPGESIEHRIARFHNNARRCEIQTTVIALYNDTLVGSASIIHQDMDTHFELSPWLASVYVLPKYRQNGIGSTLIHRIIDEGRALSVKVLYIFTPDRDSFYSRLGWCVFNREEYGGNHVVVMALQLDTLQIVTK